MTNSLLIGPVQTMLANVVYAMPARNVLGYTTTTSATMTAAIVVDMTGAETVTISADGSFSTRAPFIKSTSEIEVRLQVA